MKGFRSFFLLSRTWPGATVPGDGGDQGAGHGAHHQGAAIPPAADTPPPAAETLVDREIARRHDASVERRAEGVVLSTASRQELATSRMSTQDQNPLAPRPARRAGRHRRGCGRASPRPSPRCSAGWQSVPRGGARRRPVLPPATWWWSASGAGRRTTRDESMARHALPRKGASPAPGWRGVLTRSLGRKGLPALLRKVPSDVLGDLLDLPRYPRLDS